MRKTDLTFASYLKNSIPLGLNLYLDVIPFSLTYGFLKHYEDSRLPSIMTLLISYYMFSFGYLLGFQEAISLRCAVHFARNEYQKMNDAFVRLMCVNAVTLMVSSVIIVSAGTMLKVMNLPEDVISDLGKLLIFMLPAKLIDNYSNMFKGLLISQKIFWPFQYINLVSVVVFSGSNYLLMMVYRFGLKGFIAAYSIKVTLELTMILFFLYKLSDKQLFFWPNLPRALTGYLAEFKFAMYISLSVYGEWVSVELNHIIVAIPGSLSQITAYGLCINTISYIYYIILGQVSYFRIMASIEIGKGDVIGMKHVLAKCITYGLVVMVALSIIVLLFAGRIAELYIKDPETIVLFSHAFRIYGLILFTEFLGAMMNNVIKLIRKEELQFYLGGFFFPASMFIFAFVFGYLCGLELVGVMLSYLVTTIIYTLVLVKVYFIYREGFFDLMRSGHLLEEDLEPSLCNESIEYSVNLSGNKFKR